MQEIDPDATIAGRHRSPVAQPTPQAAVARGSSKVLIGVAAALAVVVVGGVGFFLQTSRTPVPVPAEPVVKEPVVPMAPPVAVPVAPPVVVPVLPPATSRGESDILAEKVDSITVTWFVPNPDILVIDFPNLTLQGQSFNRMAAFIEKRDLTREHVLNDGELADAIRSDNSTVETYYYGHDYRAADIRHFYAAVDAQHIPLSVPEQALRALLTREGFLAPDANKAVISIPRVGSDPFVDASGRQSLLRHELSHGEYFTNPAYAAYVKSFWSSRMTEADRKSFRGFLERQGYDPANEDLMANEMQAHLMNTTDRRYFNAPACGLPVARLNSLRSEFLAGMPHGWLRNAIAESKPKLPV